MIQVWDLLSCPPGAFAVSVSPLIEEQLSNLCLSERQRMVMSSCNCKQKYLFYANYWANEGWRFPWNAQLKKEEGVMF